MINFKIFSINMIMKIWIKYNLGIKPKELMKGKFPINIIIFIKRKFKTKLDLLKSLEKQ